MSASAGGGRLEDYVQHKAGCPWLRGDYEPLGRRACTCGLAALLASGERPKAAPGSDRVGPSEAEKQLTEFVNTFIDGFASGARSGEWYIGEAKRLMKRINASESRVGPAPSGLRATIEALIKPQNPTYRIDLEDGEWSNVYCAIYNKALADVLSKLPEEEKA